MDDTCVAFVIFTVNYFVQTILLYFVLERCTNVVGITFNLKRTLITVLHIKVMQIGRGDSSLTREMLLNFLMSETLRTLISSIIMKDNTINDCAAAHLIYYKTYKTVLMIFLSVSILFSTSISIRGNKLLFNFSWYPFTYSGYLKTFLS